MTRARYSSPKVRHIGNTANNGYFNLLILNRYTRMRSLPVESEVLHAFSAPAWEELEFTTPSEQFVFQPDWRQIPGATSLHASTVKMPSGKRTGVLPRVATLVRKATLYLGRVRRQDSDHSRLHLTALRQWLRSVRVESRVACASLKHKLQTVLRGTSSNLTILYGPNPVGFSRDDKPLILLEHGTLRWIEVGAAADARWRARYAELVEECDHLWVTNLDSPSVRMAETLAPGRWLALPHPYKLDAGAPYPADVNLHTRLQLITDSDFLLMLPASINWLSDHNKGTLEVLRSFKRLRDAGIPVGLVLVEWGRQVAEAKEMMSHWGVARHTIWLDPMPRISLQKCMSSVDLVLDQFGVGAFGALAFKTLEQGAPLLTHSLDEVGVALVGESPPWLTADSEEEIFESTRLHIAQLERVGRETRLAEIELSHRSWLIRRHHHEITAILQLLKYGELLGTHDPDALLQTEWSKIPDHGSPGWWELVDRVRSSRPLAELARSDTWTKRPS